MTNLERRQHIIERIQDDGRVAISDLVERLRVSAVTIRQDLNALQERGLLMRVRGGALPMSVLARELTLDEKTLASSALKDSIGKRASTLIQDGDNVLIDSGSTTEALAHNFPGNTEVTVLTNGFNIARFLSDMQNVELIMTGGHLRKKSQSFYGAQAESTLEHLRFNKWFLGVDGVTRSFGLTTHFGPEAALNRKMLEVAQQVVLLTDSSKFGSYGMHHIALMDVLDIVVTDDGIPDKYASHMESLGIEVLVVSSQNTHQPAPEKA